MTNRSTSGFAAILGLVIVAGAIGRRPPEPADAAPAPLPAYDAPAVRSPAPQPLAALGSELNSQPSYPLPDPPPDDGQGEYPEWNGHDLDCPDVGHPVRVTGADPHRLDRDDDGVGCESQ